MDGTTGGAAAQLREGRSRLATPLAGLSVQRRLSVNPTPLARRLRALPSPCLRLARAPAPRRCRAVALAALLFLLGCDVQTTSPSSSGVGGAGGAAGSNSCPSGLTVLLSDYLSTQIALSDGEGHTLVESVLSTGSAETDGLAFALSGDVVLPSEPPRSGEVVLIDRFGTNVITWLDPRDGQVIDQLPVGTGFESNPRDYLEVSDSLALVSRFGQSSQPGREPFDAGGDLLFIDLAERSITGSLVLPAPDGLPARPGSLTQLGGEVLVPLTRAALDYSEMGEAMIVGVDLETRSVTFSQTLSGHKNCGKLALSPDGERLAIACSGRIDQRGIAESVSQSALLLLDPDTRPLELVEVFPAAELFDFPMQGAVTFVDDERVLLKSQTPFGGKGNNTLYALELASGQATALLAAQANEDGSGKGLVFGGMACAPGCALPCIVADADRRVLQRIQPTPAGFELLEPVRVESRVGLQPLDLVYR